MAKVLLVLHVLAAVIAIGPVAVAGSMFPATARRAAVAPGSAEAVAAVRLLHRMCRVYAAAGLAIPVFGFATASTLHVLGSPWLTASIALTAVAGFLLGVLIVPTQATVIASLPYGGASTAATAAGGKHAQAQRLAALTGIFNLLWATVTILMIVRPGSTTGA